MPATYEIRLDFPDDCYLVVRYSASSIAAALSAALSEYPDATSSLLLAIVSHERIEPLVYF